MTPDQFAQDWERHLRAVTQACRAEVDKALAAMTDDSGDEMPPYEDGPALKIEEYARIYGAKAGAPMSNQGVNQQQAGQASVPDAGQASGWWSFDPLAGSDSQPAEAYVWTAPIGPTPEQAKEAEQDRLWRLVVGTARGA